MHIQGAIIEDGPDRCFALTRNMAATFGDCQAPASQG